MIRAKSGLEARLHFEGSTHYFRLSYQRKLPSRSQLMECYAEFTPAWELTDQLRDIFPIRRTNFRLWNDEAAKQVLPVKVFTEAEIAALRNNN